MSEEKKYIDLVVGKIGSTAMLFRAPAGTYLEAGDKITVETSNGGESYADVLEASSYEYEGSKTYRLLLAATGTTEPLRRVMSRYKAIEYKEGEANE